MAHELVGQVISRYRIVATLGAGGMGEVYLADDTTLGRQVALKFLPPEHTRDDERLRRFRQEAKAASALNHPNIVTIHEVGEAGDLHFIATEFIDGESLRARLSRAGGLELREALRVAVQLASALATAHAAGIVHRDVKPENVMIRRDGIVKVLDFGLAKLVNRLVEDQAAPTPTSDGALTRSGVVVGTTAYMSPEQATADRVDARSDIFAFGAVLYEIVTGQRAFQGSTPTQVVGAILTHEPKPLPAAVPAELATLIARCLRKDPARRYQSMSEVQGALADIDAELGSTLARAQAHRFRRWSAASVVLLLLATAALIWRAWREPASTAPLTAVPLTTLTGAERYPSLSPDGDRVAFSWTGPNGENPDIYVQQIGSASQLRLTTDTANDYNPVWSPNGQWIAFLRSRSDAGTNDVRLIAPLGGAERKLAEIRMRGGIGITPPHLTWCPENDCVIVTDSPGEGRPDALFAVSLETGEKRQLTRSTTPATGDTHPAVSPDGRWLVFRRMEELFTGSLYAVPFEKDATVRGAPTRLTPPTLDAQHPAWTPDSKEILFSARGSLWRQSVNGAGGPARLPFVGEYGVMPVVSRPQPGRGARLVYARHFEDGNIWRVTLPAPGAVATTRPIVAIASSRLEGMPQFSPDGRRVAFTADRSGTWEIWVSDPDGANAVQLTTLNAVASGYPHWSPDGASIAFHSNIDGQWEVYVVPAEGGKPRNVTAHPASDASPSFSRDGKWIYFSSTRSGESLIWKIPVSGGTAQQVTTGTGWGPAESPDGAHLYYVETIDRPSALLRVPIAGGPATRVLDGVALANFVVRSDGIYYIDRPPGERGIHYVDIPTGTTRLRYFSFATRTHTTIADSLGVVDVPLTMTPDGRTILYPRIDSWVYDLMLVQNFR